MREYEEEVEAMQHAVLMSVQAAPNEGGGGLPSLSLSAVVKTSTGNV